MSNEKKTEPFDPATNKPSTPPPGGQMVKRPDSAFAPVGEKGIILRTFEELRQFAAVAVKGGAAPQGMTEGGAAMAIQAGLERGLGPLGGLQYCTVINGHLSWNAQGALALIRNSPVCVPGTCDAWVEGEADEMIGVAVAHRIHYPKPFRTEFSMKDAKQAGLLKRSPKYPNKPTMYEKYPKRQLRARAIGFLARDGFSDVLGGFPIKEEAEEFDPRTPAAPETVEIASPPPAPAGPDPIMTALKKAPAVIEVTPSGPVEAPQEPGKVVTGNGYQGEIVDVGTPAELEAIAEGEAQKETLELEAERVNKTLQAEAAEKPGEAAQASTTEHEKPAEGSEVPEADPSSLRGKLGVPPPDEQPTPPHGTKFLKPEEREAEEASRKAAHLEADAELAKEEVKGQTPDLPGLDEKGNQ